MKYLKTFEKLDNDIEVGDWVALKTSIKNSTLYDYFLHIPCKVVRFDKYSIDGYNIKLRGREKEIWWRINDIEYHSKNKEDIEIYLQTRKYNL